MRFALISAALLLCACPGEDPVPAKDTPKVEPKEAPKPAPLPTPAPSPAVEPAPQKAIETGGEAALLAPQNP